MADELDPLGRIQRRRDLAASLSYPAELRETLGKFTDSRRAVLKVISGEVVKHGACTLTLDAIAGLSCNIRSTVKKTLHTAKAAGLIKIELDQRHNTITITITIISTKWKAWLDRYGDAPPDATRR
jgi:hypothetical protein